MAAEWIRAFISVGVEQRGRHKTLATDIGDHRILAAERHFDAETVQSVSHRLHRVETLDLQQFA